MSSPRLETRRLVLRPLAPRDEAPAIAFYQSDRARFVGGGLETSPLAAWKQVSAMFGHWATRGYGLWAVTEKGSDDCLGMVGPYYPVGWPEREIGWVMFDGAEGRGFAFEAAEAALEDARQRLGWRDIVHYIDPANVRSIALAKKLGATRDAKACQPKPGVPCLVYRQPTKAAA